MVSKRKLEWSYVSDSKNDTKLLYLKVCLPGECPTDSTPHCVLRSSDDCDNKHSHCALYSGCNKCSWRRCVSYYDCQDSQEPVSIQDFVL